MATAYDTWKTTEPYDAEGDFVDRRTGELVTARKKDQKVVTEVIADLLSDDGNDWFADKMARLFIKAEHANDTMALAAAASDLWADIEPMVIAHIKRDAETDAAHEWATRQTGPEE